MDRVKLVVSERTDVGTTFAKRLRKQGLIPGVLYSAGKEAKPFTVSAHDLREAMASGSGRHAVLDVVFEGHKRGHAAVFKEIQLSAVKQHITHIDLHEIQLDEPIETKVTMQLDGAAAGIKAGGVLEIVTHEINVRGLPQDIPEHIVMDISDVEIGQTVRVKDVPLPSGITALDDAEDALFHIVLPRVEEAEEGEEAAGEPEVVTKGEEQGQE
jgi:large subunit ribosomal protein L25